MFGNVTALKELHVTGKYRSQHRLQNLGARLSVPDLDEPVKRPADDELAVRREGDGGHPVRVTCQRAHLQTQHNIERSAWVIGK